MARPQVMPVFMGAPWAQRFGGPGSELSLHEWKTQTEYLAGLQGLSEQQKLQFVLGSLEGRGRSKPLPGLQEPMERLSSTSLLNFMVMPPRWLLSGPSFSTSDKVPGRTAYSLRLREQYTCLKGRRDHGLGDEDTLLRDQFLLGLRNGPIRQSLRLQLRQDPTLSFEALRREVLAQEVDHDETTDPPACMAASGTYIPAASISVNWKQELRAEVMKDVKEQMAELSKILSSPRTSGCEIAEYQLISC